MINMENREEMHIKQMNAEENYMTTPISVLSYITVLEEQNKQLLDEIEMLNFKLKAADSVNEGLEENYNKLLTMSLRMAKLFDRTGDFDVFMKDNNLPNQPK